MGIESKMIKDHLDGLSNKISPIARKALVEYLESCPCQNESDQVFAISEIVRISMLGIGKMIGYELAAKMLEALAKDLRIHEKVKINERQKT